MAARKLDEETIFNTARKIDAVPLREEYLQQVCGGDEALRGRVIALLQAHEAAHSFLRATAAELIGTVDTPPITERPGSVIGPYELMEQIGEGGFGLVFVAEQQVPVRRKVALKIIKPGMDSGEVIARFEAERQALALMEHPNIARIFDGGTTQSGRPYFVMELVKGIPIIEYCDQQQLTAKQRLDLFLVVCQPVQHAHGKGIIHRDLKPSNVLVAPHDGVPVVKVIDFGVAKAIGQQLTTKKIYTRFTQMIGTPLYMSPEQAEINALDVDIRSDVYSLGVLLCELLTGTTPFDKQRFATAAYDEIRRIIKEEEPPKPSTRLTTLGDSLPKVSAQRKTEPAKLSALVRGDLDWIVMKALEKDRTRRYETASAMAEDVRRFLNDELVQARPPSAWYRFRKMARRNKAAMTTAALVAAALLLGTVVSAWQAVRATQAEEVALNAEAQALAALDQEAKQRLATEQQRKLAVIAEADARKSEQRAKVVEEKANLLRIEALQLAQKEKVARELASEQAMVADVARQKAQENETKAEWRLYASNIASAQRAWESNDVSDLNHYLSQCRQAFRGWEHDYVYTLANHNHQTLRGHTTSVRSVAFSPDGKHLASAGGFRFQPGEVTMWDAASGKVILTLKGQTASVNSVAFSPDGKRLATASASSMEAGEVKLWDVANGNVLLTINGHNRPVQSVAFSPDGKRLASASDDKTVKLWNADNGKELLTLNGHTKAVRSVAFSPDGRRLASASVDRTVKLWELASGQEYLNLTGHTSAVISLAFSSDGKRLATSGSLDETVKLWELATGREYLTLKGHTDIVYSVAFSPDGKRLASAGGTPRQPGEVKVWDAESGKELQTLYGHTSPVLSVAFSPDGKRLASASFDETVRLWNLAPSQAVWNLKEQGEYPICSLSADGKRLAGWTSDGKVKVWDVDSCQEVLSFKDTRVGVPTKVALSPDGKCLAVPNGPKGGAKASSTTKLLDVSTGQEIRTLVGHAGETTCVAFSPDGKFLASASYDKTVKLWDLASGQVIHTLEGGMFFTVAFSPDGKRLATGSKSTIQLWNAMTGQEMAKLQGHTALVYSIAFSPDGKCLASASSDKTVKVWDAESGQAIRTLAGHADEVHRVAFSPDGKRLASASVDKTVKVWDTESGQEVITLRGHKGSVGIVAFSPDGKRLTSGAVDGTIIIWDASKSMKELEGK